MRKLTALLPALALLGSAAVVTIPRAASAQEEVEIIQAPPAVKVEVIPAAPSPRHFWIHGYWAWAPSGHFWVPGRYEVARPGWTWSEARWSLVGRRWHLYPGHWYR